VPDLEITIGNQLANAAAETTLTLEELIMSMKTSGMEDSAIKSVLMNDLNSGGRLFGNFRNQVKNTVKNGMGMAANESSHRTFEEAGVQKYAWVAVGDKSVCVDCERRHGEEGTMEYHRNIGEPRSGFSICQSSCRCKLVPVDYDGEDFDEPLLRDKKKTSAITEDEHLNGLLSKANVSPKKAMDDMKSFAGFGDTPDSMLLGLAEEYGIKGADAHYFVNYVKDLPEDLERYLKKTPNHLGGFDYYMEKWTHGVDIEGRDGAAMTFWDFKDVRDYTQAELVMGLRNQGYTIKSLESFRNSKFKLYRVGGTRPGYNSFFMNKEQGINYQKRFGVDTLSEYEAYGEDIIPTRSGGGEVVVNDDDVLNETFIDI